MTRWALAVVVLLLGVLTPARGRAQQHTVEPPKVYASVDNDVTAVGEIIHLTMRATSDEAVPDNPQLASTPGFNIRGRPSVSTGEMQTSMNGVFSSTHMLNATWSLEATRAGTFNIGPLSIGLAGHRYNVQKVPVRVLPAGQGRGQNPRDPRTLDPFAMLDPWKNMMNGGQDPDDTDALRRLLAQQQDIETDAHFALPSARGRDAFLHAEIDKTHVVVGEQVTYSVYYYQDATLLRGPPFSEDREPGVVDFVQHELTTPGAEAKVVANARAGDRVWLVRLIKRTAFFPLKTGDLEIGRMAVTLDRRRPGEDPHRDTESFVVHVTEPPVAGRPPGYAIGDVGHFDLTADVAPREVEKGGSVAVTFDLSGTGNIPGKLTPPARSDVEWLEGQTRDTLGAKGDKWGGKRTFAFVARVLKEGTVDLGDVSVPYWDPATNAYAVARVSLGKVDVKPGGAADVSKPVQGELLDGLPAPRTTREGPRAFRRHFADSPLFWLGLGLSPLAYVVAMGARTALRRVRARRAERATSPLTELKSRVAAAESANRGSDARALDAATVRVLEAAAIARVGVNVRGARDGERAGRLEQGGVPRELSVEFEAALKACETARFAPEPPTVEDARARWERARRTAEALEARG